MVSGIENVSEARCSECRCRGWSSYFLVSDNMNVNNNNNNNNNNNHGGRVVLDVGSDLMNPFMTWTVIIGAVSKSYALFQTGDDQYVRMVGFWTEEQWIEALSILGYLRRMRACLETVGNRVLGRDFTEEDRMNGLAVWVADVEELVQEFGGVGVVPGDIRAFWRSAEIRLGVFEPTLTADELVNPNEADGATFNFPAMHR